MTAQALLDSLQARGVQLQPDGDGVLARPASRLTDADREAIRRHKVALLRMLSSEAGAQCEHVSHDSELADWYRRNPHLACARCFLGGRPLRSWPQ